jgi:hypothetical protein
MKEVPSFSNTADNNGCLQACVKDVLAYYFPKRLINDKEINEKTGQCGGWTWLPPAACWLNNLGLDVKLYWNSKNFDYKSFALYGTSYLKKQWSSERFDWEEQHGAYKNIDFVQEKAKEMVNKNIYVGKRLSTALLLKFLGNQESLAVAKTIYQWLSGDYVLGDGHFVVVIDSPKPGFWRINDPGLPEMPNREISSKIKDHPVFLDTLLIKQTSI